MNDPSGVLGRKVTGALEHIETFRFKDPHKYRRVLMTSDEVTALCPVTHQPDYYRVEIDFKPNELGIESKSLKLYLHGFRDRGVFCEDLAQVILDEVWERVQPDTASVRVVQKSRGGVTIEAEVWK